MYLKCLEIIGFKSFAEKTVLTFEPGMTAVVGPNGCGKSNVADAVRWVLGEQSAKAMRGSNMTDVIFNGTDTHKPLGMAEVSMTLADCEKVLGMEYNEVTITRRVFRSGEGQYFINKAPCRLKDIQRLFMDTGVGTNSYSLMEQGRIDRILSSRPEDRREVFEEASGITKYKADQKEAMRKLEQTEANLLRLADIIREVKRQIISLQRQAGKARRYQELQGKLKSIDIYAARERLTALDQEIATLEARLASISEQDEAIRHDVDSVEQQSTQTRVAMSEVENLINEAMEAAVRSRTELERLRETIRHNEDRIAELKTLEERDTRDAGEARARLDQHREALQGQLSQLTTAKELRDQTERELAQHAARLNECEHALEEAHKLVHRLRTEQLESESRVAQLQNDLSSLDAEDRTNMIRRERLAAEHSEMQRALQVFQSRKADIDTGLHSLQSQADQAGLQVETLSGRKNDKSAALENIKKNLSDLHSRAAARQAQIELLQMSDAQREGFPEGAQWMLDSKSVLPVDRASIWGPLAELIRAEPQYHLALEAVLRPWLDAIVLKDGAAAVAALAALEKQGKGSARLLFPAETKSAGPQAAGDALLKHVHCSDNVRPLAQALLHNVVVVDSADQMDFRIAADAIVVTKGGSVIRGNGSAEHWERAESRSNPLARQQLLGEWSGELSALRAEIQSHDHTASELLREESTVVETLARAREALESARHNLSLAQGEAQVIGRETEQARERVETVAWEIKSLGEQNASGDDRRQTIFRDIENLRNRQGEIRTTLAAKTEELRDLDQQRAKVQGEVTEHRVRFSECRQQVENLTSRNEQAEARIAELQAVIEERSRGILSYQARIEDLNKAIAEAGTRLKPLEAEGEAHQQRLSEARGKRDILNASMQSLESELRQKRKALDDVRARRSQQDIELAEQRMRRSNIVERVTGEYRITTEEIASHAEPEWENGQRPDRDALETMIAEYRTKMEAMGPVNLVAIEEHRELEERQTFLTGQQTDLVNAKQQLMDLIREINKKTTEMFSATFEQVNKNFQEMFSKLFGGGSAKLVLVDEQDILESGIEIIARPPGKKLQTVSLLSGGERTMTAVALLFSLYLVRPSAFCVLDELDAALDEANIGRFVRTVQGFLDRSQFIVITHNRMTIAAAQVLYGVTMEQHGVSKIVSVRFNSESAPPPAAAAQPDPVPATS